VLHEAGSDNSSSLFTCVDTDLLWFGLVYLFIHSLTHVTLDMSITDYNLYITT